MFLVLQLSAGWFEQSLVIFVLKQNTSETGTNIENKPTYDISY